MSDNTIYTRTVTTNPSTNTAGLPRAQRAPEAIAAQAQQANSLRSVNQRECGLTADSAASGGLMLFASRYAGIQLPPTLRLEAGVSSHAHDENWDYYADKDFFESTEGNSRWLPF